MPKIRTRCNLFNHPLPRKPEYDTPTQTNTRSTTAVSTKIMNSFRLALTVGFLSLISPLLAGTGPELQPGPSPSEENKNSTELFAYETVYTGDSDFYDDHGTFGHGDSLYN